MRSRNPRKVGSSRCSGSRVLEGVRGKGVRSVGGAEHHASARLPSVTIKGDAFLSIFTDEETEALRTQ